MIDAVRMDNYHFSTINCHLKRQGQPCSELLLSSARIAYKFATPAIPPFSKDTMKEGAMCLWVTSNEWVAKWLKASDFEI